MPDESEFRIRIISDADTSGFKSAAGAAKSLHIESSDLNDETKRQLGLIPPLEKETQNLADAGGSATKSMLGMRQVSQELNRIIPGLGLAFRGLNATMGPFIVLALAIEAVQVYWKMYQDSVEAAAEAQGRAASKMSKATREIREENERFATSERDARNAVDEMNTTLAAAETILNAQLKAKKDLLEVDKKAALAKATTPEERAAVERKYQGLEEKDELAGREAKIKLLNDAMADAKNQLADYKTAEAVLQQKIKAASEDRNDAELVELKKQVEKNHKEQDDLRKEYERLQDKRNTAMEVNFIEYDETVFARNRTISKAVEAMDIINQGGKLNPEQAEANRVLTQIFGQYSNGILSMTTIMRQHLAQSTSLVQEVETMKEALSRFQGHVTTLATIR